MQLLEHRREIGPLLVAVQQHVNSERGRGTSWGLLSAWWAGVCRACDRRVERFTRDATLPIAAAHTLTRVGGAVPPRRGTQHLHNH